ncbi:hypothetical protein [Schlesneria sp.]|uniref:hypothetical protein n=1 Tax=Schlesneria sp. TaxID=2762018 RepID=UPI002EE4C542
MKALLRNAAAVFVGLLVLFVLVTAVEVVTLALHPYPENFTHTMEEVCQHVERFPAWILGLAAGAWAISAYLSTWVTRRMGSPYSAAVVGVLLLAALFGNLAMLPYPEWFKATAGIAVFVATAFAIFSRTNRSSPVVETPLPCEQTPPA